MKILTGPRILLMYFFVETEYFKNSFFPHFINEWNKLDPNNVALVVIYFTMHC